MTTGIKLVVACVCVSFALANDLPSQEADTAAWIAKLRGEAVKRVSAGTVDQAFQNFKPLKRVVELDRRQPEFTLTFTQYLNRVVPQQR